MEFRRRFVLFVSVISILACLSQARPEYLAKIPNGNAWNRPGSGITCEFLGHTPCSRGVDRNQFGKDFKVNNYIWDKKLCEMDSDGDGVSNGQELGDPCCQWSEDRPVALRQDGLSHPGDAADDAAIEAPGCSADMTTAPPPLSPAPASTLNPSAEQSPAEADPSPSEAAAPVVEETPVPAEPETTPADSPSTQGPPAVVSDDPTPQPDDDGACFPGHATVKLETGVVKAMRVLEVGDRVEVGRGLYSDVFMFTHKIDNVVHEFITIKSVSVEKIIASVTLTQGHYLYVNGKLATAGSVVVGDELELASGESSTVMDVSCAAHKGLFNPQTTHGDLVVDSVRVSTYTTAVQTSMAHSLLAPLRVLYRLVGWTTSAFEAGADKIVALLR